MLYLQHGVRHRRQARCAGCFGNPDPRHSRTPAGETALGQRRAAGFDGSKVGRIHGCAHLCRSPLAAVVTMTRMACALVNPSSRIRLSVVAPLRARATAATIMVAGRAGIAAPSRASWARESRPSTTGHNG